MFSFGMKKSSTGALSKAQKRFQDDRYAQGHTYDYVILGSGMSALSIGALLAHAGKKVCMLEAHDVPGGMAHTFKIGDYNFCAQVHYIWGCYPGGRVYEFLKKIGLEKEITFELLDLDGYDRMVMPDGRVVRIPYGFAQLAKNIEQVFPGQGEKVEHFTSILMHLRKEMQNLPDRKITWWDMVTKWYKAKHLIRYLHKTVQDVFDECGLSKEAQAVLIANAGDFMAPPHELSILAYCCLFCGYNTGAYYPTRHFKFMVDRIAEFITSHKGSHIYFETEVTGIEIKDQKVTKVSTKDGKTFTAPFFICNMDPQKSSYLIGREKFQRSLIKKIDYRYSPSGIMIYLGLNGIDLKKYGFGNFNTWHLEQWDMNEMWKEQGQGDFSRPWVFMSTPSLHTSDKTIAPKGGQILEVATYMEFEPTASMKVQDYRRYNQEKQRIAERLLDIVEKKYIPNLRKHIVVKTIGTPSTHADFCMAPFGNAYGSYFSPDQIGLKRLNADTPFKNLWWCNASSGGGGIHGTVGTGIELYMKLTGDQFFASSNIPPDEELIRQIRERKIR